MRPSHIYHFDWGTDPKKRWLARAELNPDGRYAAESPSLVGDLTQLIPSIREECGRRGCALVGFDFPIGVPARYARLARIDHFKSLLLLLGSGHWADFFTCAKLPAEISVHRPFYPFKPGGTSQTELLRALGLQSIDDLRRRCEKNQPNRRAACALFWTLGANQVGMWPFDGNLGDLLQPGKIVIVETYPAECYIWFFGSLSGKTKQEVRRGISARLLKWAAEAGVHLEDTLLKEVEEGFPRGDDAFDAVVGLFGMLEVVTGKRQSGEPKEDTIRNLEGWILGQSASAPTG